MEEPVFFYVKTSRNNGGSCFPYAVTSPKIETVFSMASMQSACKRSEIRSKMSHRKSEVGKLVVEEEMTRRLHSDLK
jgi:hypothetical protein